MKIKEALDLFENLQSIKMFKIDDGDDEPSITIRVCVDEDGHVRIDKDEKYIYFQLDQVKFLIESLQKIQEAI